MKYMILFALLVYVIPRSAIAQNEDSLRVDVKSFIDTYHALRIEQPNDWMSSKTRLRSEINVEKNNAGAFISANIIYNSILKDQTGLQMREAYVYYSNEHWDMRAGRQIITWGVADGLRLTDIISPMDYTEFLAQDYDDIRIPVDGLRLRYSRYKWCFEAVAIPVNTFFKIPTDMDNPWSVGNLPIEPEPKHKLKNMEYGSRLSYFLNKVDFSISALRTWNKIPVLCNNIGVYRRITMLGADISVPLKQFVIRSEIATYLDEAQPTTIKQGVPQATSINMLLGIDWYAGNDWFFSAQYNHRYVNFDKHHNSGLATLRISKELLNNAISLQNFTYIDITNKGIYNRLSADYSLNDQLHTIVGFDSFRGSNGSFAIYKHNSEIWIKLKYSF